MDLLADRLALSVLDWWEEAGVDTLVDERPRDWLMPVAAPTPEPSSAAIADAPRPDVPDVAPTPALPADLVAFRAWLLADAAIPSRPSARLDASGDPASGTMIVLDMPEAEDRLARRLLAGEAGALFDRMLGAMGLSRETAYLVPFAPARPAAGSLDAAAAAVLLPLLRHHVALARPRRLLLMGEAPVRALLGLGCHEARGLAHRVEIAGVVPDVPTIASFAPRFLLQASAPEDLKARRAQMWADLQLFMAL